MCILTYFDCSIFKIVTFLLRYIFLKSINIGPLISHCFRITNQLSIIFLKTSIYIQIVIRWASIHRLSICIIDLPTTGFWATRIWIQRDGSGSSSKNSKKNLDSYCFMTPFGLFILVKLCKCTFKK